MQIKEMLSTAMQAAKLGKTEISLQQDYVESEQDIVHEN
jgi:hypothetical protein